MSRWRIYYGDGTTYSDRDGSPLDAPNKNVQVIVRECKTAERGFALMHSKDAFVWRDDQWNGVDNMGLWDHLFLSQTPVKILFGRSIRDDDFWKIVGHASKEGLG